MEGQLAQTVHGLTDEAVVYWGDKIGTHGADVISVNMKTGRVTLWDAKFRSNPVRIKASTTFIKTDPLNNAVNEAILEINNNITLPADIRLRAIQNLRAGSYRTRTVGMGAAKNSVLR